MSSIAKGYAEALIMTVGPELQKRISEELFAIERIITQQRAFFLNPRIASGELIAVFTDALSEHVHPHTLNFLCLLASRRLLIAFSAIQMFFDDLVQKGSGEVKVRLRVPYSPSEALVSELKQYLAETGLFPKDKAQEAKFNVMLDKSLIGGFYAEYNGRVLDASLRTRLDMANPQWRQGAL